MSKAYRFEVINKKVWRNALTGNLASIYGAVPGGDGWKVIEVGYTYQDNQSNTTGSYGTRDLHSKAEIENYLTKTFGPEWPLIHTKY
jgi:hypothetical protein